MRLLPVLTLTIFLFCQISLEAQPTFSGWLASFNTIKTGKKTSIGFDFQVRSSDEIKQIQTILLRPGFNVQLNKHFTVTAGYAFISNKRTIGDVNGYAPEHRIWEQLLINHKLDRVAVSHRFRVEQRFMPTMVVDGDELEKTATFTAHRFRYFIRGLIPFKKEPEFKKGMFAALQNETFLNFGNIDAVNGESFDQNRLYLAVGYRLSPKFDLETGYLNQYTNGRNKAFTNNHVVQLAGYLRL